MHFSELAQNLGGAKNPLYMLPDRLKARSRPIVDLVRGNVNEHGIVYPQHILDEILVRAAEAARIYRPDSFGQPLARRAIAEYYTTLNIPADRILITPGTSVSYWYCFKLLAEPHSEFLCPRPSYPLFDYIAQVCDVHLTYYRLAESQRWAIDLDYLEHQITTRTRGIILISPHNPTGMVASIEQLTGLADIASRHSLPIISDEVFSEFLFGIRTLPRIAETHAPLVFTLNGFSKMFALPGMKIGWVAVTGNDALARKAMSALELISDTFLPVNDIAQLSVPQIFKHGQEFLTKYAAWVKRCRGEAVAALSGTQLLEPQGGFYITVRTEHDEQHTAEQLLEQDGILVHPGHFYDIDPDHLVMTFISEPKGIPAVFGSVAQKAQK